MLRLVHHTSVFGPLCFEYSRRVVRVGSCSDNDLILLHPSVRPYHCVLLFAEDTVQLVPKEAVSDLGVEDKAVVAAAPSYRPGDLLPVGEVRFRVEHSSNSMTLPEAPEVVAPGVGLTREGYWRADFEGVPEAARWWCPRCGLRFTNVQVRVLGLVAHRKYALCPKCSLKVDLLGLDPESRGLLGRLRTGWRRLRRELAQGSREGDR
jgi:hypothetical protein